MGWHREVVLDMSGRFDGLLENKDRRLDLIEGSSRRYEVEIEEL